MDLQTYLDILFNDAVNPCSISELATDKIVYMNTAMVKMLRETDDYFNKKCYEVTQGRKARCEFCPNHVLQFRVFQENYVYNGKMNQHFRVNNTLLQYDGVDYNLCKYFIAPSYNQQEITFEEVLEDCRNILPKEEKNRLNAFLELLARFYNCEESYIYQVDNKNGTMSCSARWSKEHVCIADMKQQQNLPAGTFIQWLDHSNELNMIEANSVLKNFEESSMEARILDELKISNVVLCRIQNQEGLTTQLVGLNNRKEPEFDYRLLQTVTRLIEQNGNREKMVEILKQVEDTDFLTGCFSRKRYLKTQEEVAENPPKTMGVVFATINGLQKTNQFFGSAKGDSHIKKSVEIMKSHFDQPFYRVSGEEFVAFFPETLEKDFTDNIDAIRQKMKDNQDFSFSLGDSWGSGRFHLDKLISEANTMMIINKQAYYHTVDLPTEPVNSEILGDLLTFLAEDEFQVYLQPQVDLTSGQVIGAEALIRRFDKTNQKMVFPDQFIPLYEQESIIRHVDMFVVEKVCQLQVEWEKYNKNVPVSVNLSRVTLLEFGIVDTIAAICDSYNVDHELVIIEVTERVGLIENDVASSLIDAFVRKGFKISLDDFGCAYSNIVTLVKISVDEVKIDKSLVDDLMYSEKNQIIVGNILNMCNSFQNTHTLAEGIEEEAQAEILREYGCSYGQGYLYSRPIPNEEFFEKYIQK